MNEEFYAAIVADPQHMLQHYGVLGMKWGIRRYQNPDGTLTKLGKQHLADGKTQEAIDKWEQKKNTAIAKGNKKFVEKNLDYMSNEDINRFNERLRARNTINNLKQDARKIDSEKIKTWMNTASNVTQNAANIASNGVNLYNTIAKLHNTFGKGDKWKLIKDDQQQEKDKDKNKNKDQQPSIKEVFRNGELESKYTTSYDSSGRKIEKEEHFKTDKNKNSKKEDNGDDNVSSSTPKDNGPKTPSGGGGSSKGPERVTGEVVSDGSTRQQHQSRHDTSTVEGKWRDVTPSGALTVYTNYKQLTTSSKSDSNSSKSESNSSSSNSGFKNNWNEKAAKGYQDVDDYTEELLRKGRNG